MKDRARDSLDTESYIAMRDELRERYIRKVVKEKKTGSVLKEEMLALLKEVNKDREANDKKFLLYYEGKQPPRRAEPCVNEPRSQLPIMFMFSERTDKNLMRCTPSGFVLVRTETDE